MRQHGDDAVNKIYTGAAQAGLQIQRTVFPHIMADIGDMDSEPEQIRAETLNMYSVI